MLIKNCLAAYLLIGVLALPYAQAQPRIAVLEFELNDITSLPNTLQEQKRTATLAPLLRQELIAKGVYQLVDIDRSEQQRANVAFGYLFRLSDVAAELGEKYQVDWMVVSQHSKPSHLFSYLMAKLVHVGTGRVVKRFDIELKGNHEKVTMRGIRRLAADIDESLQQFESSAAEE